MYHLIKKSQNRNGDRNGEIKIIPHKLWFIDRFRFMSTSLSTLVTNLSKVLHNDKCIDCKSCLDFVLIKDNQWNCIQLIFKCSKCNKNHNKSFNKDLINRFASSYKFCDGDINKFILLLRKGVYPYEYMDIGKDLMKYYCPIKNIFIVA